MSKKIRAQKGNKFVLERAAGECSAQDSEQFSPHGKSRKAQGPADHSSTEKPTLSEVLCTGSNSSICPCCHAMVLCWGRNPGCRNTLPLTGTAVPVKELSWEVNPLLRWEFVSCSRDLAEQEWGEVALHNLKEFMVSHLSVAPRFPPALHPAPYWVSSLQQHLLFPKDKPWRV